MNRTLHTLGLIAMLCCGSAAWCEDAASPTPPLPAPAPAPESTAPQKPAPDYTPLEPTVVSGPKPTFPLTSGNFLQIDDQYNDAEGASNIEPEALEDVLRAVRASTQEELIQHVNPEVTYATMMNKPETCRGAVARVSGTLRYVVERDQHPAFAGVTKYWKGQISVGTQKITTFISLEPLPTDVQVNVGVNVVGVFMKRYVYLNNEPGSQGTWTPLLVCRRIDRVTDYDHVATGAMNSPIGIGLFIFIGALCTIFFLTRGSKARYSNKFSEMKANRSNNGGRNFPRPG